MVMSVVDVLAFLLVGAFWGCTNPLIRKGSTEVGEANTKDHVEVKQQQQEFSLWAWVGKLGRLGVWLPYAMNQVGSLLYYVLLANYNMSLAVPVCNGLALVFSSLTSHALGERVDKPIRAVVGSLLVIVGVGICMDASMDNENA